MFIFLEVYGPIFLGNSILKILLYIVHRHLSLTCAFRLIILCVSSEDLSEVLRRMSLLYFTFQNMKVFKGYLLFSPRKCNKKLRLSIRMSENWKKKWLKRLTPVTFSSTFWEGNFFVSIPLFILNAALLVLVTFDLRILEHLLCKWLIFLDLQ